MFCSIGWVQSLLINGRGQYNCSLAAKFSNSSISQCKFEGNEKCSPQVLKVRPNKTYRLRIASTTALASLNLAIEVFFILFSLTFAIILIRHGIAFMGYFKYGKSHIKFPGKKPSWNCLIA